MQDKSLPTRYGALAQAFHWIIAALIITQFALALIADGLPLGLQKLVMLARHKSVGMTILVLAVLRLIWRLFNPPPPLPPGMSRFEQLAARVTHVAMYCLLFILPISGWLMSSAKNYPVSWFSLFTWPDLIAPSEAAFAVLLDTHLYLGRALFVITLLHILAALKHHFWTKDDVLLRMLPFTRSGNKT